MKIVDTMHKDLATTAEYLDLIGKDVLEDFNKINW